MGKRGLKPQRKVNIKWSSNFAYALGLIASDGCLYSDGLHINLTSKDLEQIENFRLALNLNNKIGKKSRSPQKKKDYYVIQFGDVVFYDFLKSIGIGPAKSKTIGMVKIPKKYFFDFLRGVFDGDGYSYSYWDKRWKSSFMIYIGFVSASRSFINWLQNNIFEELTIWGHITTAKKKSQYFQLKYSKHEAIKIFRKLYYSNRAMHLSRKRLKIERALDIVGEKLP